MKRSIPLLSLVLSAVFVIGIILGTQIHSYPTAPPEATASARMGEFRAGEYRVARVLDGDTIVLSEGTHIRYYGIDAPELRDRWGEAAAALNRTLVLDKQVRILPSHARDLYGRIIADVWIGETLVTEALVKEGYAKVKIIKGEAKSDTLPRLLSAEAEARQNHWGLWIYEKSTSQTSF